MSIASSSPTKPRLSRTLLIDFILVHAQFVQAVGNVLANAQGIEERRFLKHHSDLLANVHELLFVHAT